MNRSNIYDRNFFDRNRIAASEAGRALLRSPVHASMVVLILGLAIAACAAQFALLDRLLFPRLPYPEADRLVQVYNIYPRATPVVYGTLSVPDFLDRRDQADALGDLALYHRSGATLGTGAGARRVRSASVSASLFSTLGVQPVLGSGFDETAMIPGNGDVAVISNRLWRDRFGGDPDLIGTDIVLDGRSVRVAGVMPRGFYFPDHETEVWTPFEITASQRSDGERRDEYAQAVGRLADGADVALLNAQFDAIAARNRQRVGGQRDGQSLNAYLESTGLTGRAMPLRRWLSRDGAPRMLLANAAVLILLLIAAFNVAQLRLVRLLQRTRDLTVRQALGADRGTLVLSSVWESVWTGLAGSIIGLLLAVVAFKLVAGHGWTGSVGMVIDGSVVAWTGLVTCVAIVIGVLIPLVMFRRLNAQWLRSGARSGVGPGMRRVQNALAITQNALAFVLLAGFAALMQALVSMQRVDPGFEVEGLEWSLLELPSGQYPDPSDRASTARRILDHMREHSGLSAGLVSHLPLSGGDWNEGYRVAGRAAVPGEPPADTHVRAGDPGYLEAMGIGLVDGRWFTAADDADSVPVAVIDRNFAATAFPDTDPIGQRVRLTGNRTSEQWLTVVGVVDSVHHLGLDAPPVNETLYVPYAQQPLPWMMLVARPARAGAVGLSVALRETLAAIEPGLVPTRGGRVGELVDRALGSARRASEAFAAMGMAALILAVLGVYGVINTLVRERQRELGIRRALGASGFRVGRMLIAHAARFPLLGIGAGTVAVLGLQGRIHLPGVPSLSLGIAVLLATAGSVILATLVSALVPAWRAARLSPARVLRAS